MHGPNSLLFEFWKLYAFWYIYFTEFLHTASCPDFHFVAYCYADLIACSGCILLLCPFQCLVWTFHCRMCSVYYMLSINCLLFSVHSLLGIVYYDVSWRMYCRMFAYSRTCTRTFVAVGSKGKQFSWYRKHLIECSKICTLHKTNSKICIEK